MFDGIFDEIETWMRELLTGIINSNLDRMKKRIDSKLAAELLKSGQATVKDFYSYKKDMYFEADLVMDYKDGRVNFSIVFPDRNSSGRTKHK